MSSTEERIKHYQRNIDRIITGNIDNNERLLYCINQLNRLAVTVQHLQITGVGRTVNALRKIDDGIGDAAKRLVAKWKVMVANASPSSEEDESCINDASETYDSFNTLNHSSEVRNNVQSYNSTQNENNAYSEAVSRSPEMIINTDDGENSLNGSREYEETENPASFNNPRLVEEKEKHRHKSLKHSSNKDNSKKDRHISSKHKHESSKNDKRVEKPEFSNSGKKRRNDSNSRENIKKKKLKSESDEDDTSINNTANHDLQLSEGEKEADEEKQEQGETSDDMEIDEGEHEEMKKSPSKNHSKDKQSSQKGESYSDKSRSKSKHHNSSLSHGDKSKKHSSSKSDDGEKTLNRSKESKSKSLHSSSSDKSSKDKDKNKDKREKHRDKESIDKHKKNDKEKGSHKSSKDKSEDEHKKPKEHKKKKHKDHKEKKLAKKDEVSDDDGATGIDGHSGTSFADALGMWIPPRSKKKKESSSSSISKSNRNDQPSSSRSSSSKTVPKPKEVYDSPNSPDALSLLSPSLKLEPLNQIHEEVDLSATLPEPCLNYKPLPQINVAQRKYEEDLMLSQVIHAKNQRTKVYSGNKGGYAKIPTLIDLCTRVLIENIDALEFTGGVPYHVLKPVLERASPDQLIELEYYNDYLIEESDELWRFHCNKEFRNKKQEEDESWRDMFMRCRREREEKLEALKVNIKQNIDNSQPVRSTKLAYVDVVKPPRNVLRKQARFGTANVTSKSSEAKKKIIAAASGAGGSGIPPIGEKVPAPVPLGRSRNISTGAIKKPKAPLMMKTLQALRGRFKR